MVCTAHSRLRLPLVLIITVLGVFGFGIFSNSVIDRFSQQPTRIARTKYRRNFKIEEIIVSIEKLFRKRPRRNSRHTAMVNRAVAKHTRRTFDIFADDFRVPWLSCFRVGRSENDDCFCAESRSKYAPVQCRSRRANRRRSKLPLPGRNSFFRLKLSVLF